MGLLNCISAPLYVYLCILIFNFYYVAMDGDFTIAKLTFEPASGASAGDECDLEITNSRLLTAEPIPSEILHVRINGKAHIKSCILGDMNGNGKLNAADCRYLAKHIGGDPLYNTLYADGDVNSNGRVNANDCRYLAKHIGGDPEYAILYP